MYCSSLVSSLPGQFLSSPERTLDNFFTEFQSPHQTYSNFHSFQNVSVTSASLSQLPNKLLHTSFVLVRRDNHISPLDTRYEGPYTVVKCSLHPFQLQIGNKLWESRALESKQRVLVNRLKPAFVAKGTQPAQPAPLGRPKGSPNIQQSPSKTVKCTKHAPTRVRWKRSVRVSRPPSRLSL